MGENIEELSWKLEQILHVPAGNLASRLTERSRAVLGARPLLYNRQTPYKPLWNPADDQCTAVEIFFQSHQTRRWLISGELFVVEYAGETQEY
jgi:hypothetical protein